MFNIKLSLIDLWGFMDLTSKDQKRYYKYIKYTQSKESITKNICLFLYIYQQV